MKEIFDLMLEDEVVIRDLKDNPIKQAVFFALHEFVKKGNELAGLPWFALTQFGRAHQEKNSVRKLAA